jgi:putative acetyltransferase
MTAISGNTIIRLEKADDIDAIYSLTKRAFVEMWYSGGNEQTIIDELRRSGALSISLVAEHAGNIVGHIAFSPVRAEDQSKGWYTLGSISVEPEFQRKGIGRQLIEDGTRRLQSLHAAGCILIGDPSFYSRFGFVRHPELCPLNEPAEFFMILSLDGKMPKGVMAFDDAFHTKSEQ